MKVVGAESLIRWQKNKILGFVSPEEFIGITESNGQIHEIGLWVLEETLKLMDEYPDLHMAINASSLQFMNSLLYDKLKENIESGRLDPRKLEVEITERILMEKYDTEDNRLLHISNLGISLSLDDFGTGYSSLSYLRFCPVSTLKIDKSFVSNMPDHANEVLCKTILAMSKALGLQVVAEGIETAYQKDFLREHGCELSQGYHFSKPLPKDEFIAYYKKGVIA